MSELKVSACVIAQLSFNNQFTQPRGEARWLAPGLFINQEGFTRAFELKHGGLGDPGTQWLSTLWPNISGPKQRIPYTVAANRGGQHTQRISLGLSAVLSK